MKNIWAKEELSYSCRNLRIACLLGGVIALILPIIWYHPSSILSSRLILGLIFSLIFLGVLFLTYKSAFVRNKSSYILNIICYCATIATIDASYRSSFDELQEWTLIFVMFVVTMIMTKISQLLIYLTTMLTATTCVIYMIENPVVKREVSVTMLVMFCTAAFIFMRSRLHTENDLAESERHYRNLVETSPQAIILHQDGEIVYTNQTAVQLTGAASIEELLNVKLKDIIHPDYWEDEEQRTKMALLHSKQNFIEQKLVRLDGREIEVLSNIICVTENKKPAFMSLFSDITERKKIEYELIEAESKYRSLVESALIGVFLIQDNKIKYVNPYIESLIGYSLEELIAMNIMNLVTQWELSSKNSSDDNDEGAIHYYRAIRKDGSIIYVEACVKRLILNNVETSIGTVRDITAQKKTEEQIKFMAFYDELTGLPNRYMLNDYLDNMLNSPDTDEKKIAIMFIDLDRFKIINDTLGHKFGDIILQQVSKRLKQCFRKDDLVCRYGGDEFVIVLRCLANNEITNISDRIISAFIKPFNIDSKNIFSSPSIGISIFPDDGDDAETLIKNADSAMYLAKERGRNNYRFYVPSLNKAVSRKMDLQNALRTSLINDEFVLYYQPQFELGTNKLAGLEALIRWQHPTLGLVSPAEFIPLAEETGLIVGIGEWVLRTACKQNKIWHEISPHKVPVSVNVSAYQLHNSDFVKTVERALYETKLKPEFLIAEITESIFQDTSKTNVITRNLRERGIKIAIDDFGTGYSSLSLLKDLKLDIIKIDPLFTRDIGKNEDVYIILRNIIKMGHELGYVIVAEGIEDEEQAMVFKHHNCDIGQGYLFSRPLDDKHVMEFLRG
ncbi:MAG TPA: EAL domain-containing protein [Clostridia bacterium]